MSSSAARVKEIQASLTELNALLGVGSNLSKTDQVLVEDSILSLRDELNRLTATTTPAKPSPVQELRSQASQIPRQTSALRPIASPTIAKANLLGNDIGVPTTSASARPTATIASLRPTATTASLRPTATTASSRTTEYANLQSDRFD
jgi:hypothetical protein